MTSPTLRDCTEEATWWPHIDEAVRTLARGALAVIPTDTVYGLAADAFSPGAVAKLLDAKGRGRQMPPPVLIADVRTLDGLASDVSEHVRNLVEKFWPGPLTIIVNAQPTLMWDLGETQGTVALRMPDEPCALALLRRTGPLAVSSANQSGQPAALTAADAADQLGDAVDIYLDAGAAPGAVASTIIDATGPELQIVRHGAIGVTELVQVAPIYAPKPIEEAEPAAGAGDETGEVGTGAEHERAEATDGGSEQPQQPEAGSPVAQTSPEGEAQESVETVAGDEAEPETGLEPAAAEPELESRPEPEPEPETGPERAMTAPEPEPESVADPGGQPPASDEPADEPAKNEQDSAGEDGESPTP